MTRYVPAVNVADPSIAELYAGLAFDEERNQMIVADICRAIQGGRSPLVLTARTEHAKVLAALVSTLGVANVFLLLGGQGKRQREKALAELVALPGTAPRVIVATGSYVGEGFDDARLDTLFLASPVSWKGTLQQYVGRLHRLHENKREVHVYDYVDQSVPTLARMFRRRCAGYNILGYSVECDGREPAAS